MHPRGIWGSKGPGTEHNTQPSQECTGAQPGNGESDPGGMKEAQTHLTATGVQSTLPAEVLPSHPGRHSALLTWTRWTPAPGPLCGRMADRAGAQSKLNLHLGAPSGRSARRSHRSPLMASSKCEAAASAPRVRAPPPSPCAWCKMVFTKVNIGLGARPGHQEPPLASPA